MTGEKAFEKYIQYFNGNDISDVVEVNGGFVFYSFESLQPVYVDENGIHGLNGNVEDDRRIIDISAKILLERGQADGLQA